jgi:hypothetical protein
LLRQARRHHLGVDVIDDLTQTIITNPGMALRLLKQHVADRNGRGGGPSAAVTSESALDTTEANG